MMQVDVVKVFLWVSTLGFPCLIGMNFITLWHMDKRFDEMEAIINANRNQQVIQTSQCSIREATNWWGINSERTTECR